VRIFHFDDARACAPAHPANSGVLSGRRIRMQGTVQGVGFRPWVYRVACDAAVTGRVRNDTAGVTIEAFGSTATLDAFVDRLEHDLARPAAAVVERVDSESIGYENLPAFSIDPSVDADELRVSIPPDLATCPECLSEVHDPSDRRFGYAFTNCTNCGPRFTIVNAAPYDRPATTMARFRMCPACRREYDSVADRRFHAQPNACPDCGPRLNLLSADGTPHETVDPIADAARALREGRIVAIKGVGGFQLACDATSDEAIRTLRDRKHRDEKPFAVMVRSLDDARALADLTSAEEALLQSVERPIVLARRRGSAKLATLLAPRNPLVGILLANTALHDLLLAAAGRPLVMTSGNLSEEPIARENSEALARLRGIADLFLVHDRDIVTRCDDSVARIIGGKPVVMRRARGYVPRPIRLAAPVNRPVLACGAQLKNTFCFVRSREAVLGPHVGDLDSVSVFEDYKASIERLSRFLSLTPEIVAHDLHPDYLSTRYALERSGVRAIGVQHHHAHVASAMAEHGLEGPVIGLAYDGTGYGLDGAAWGGEILHATYDDFTRMATFRPIALAGGDVAIRQPWRLAFALMDDAFGGEPPVNAFAVFRRIPRTDLDVVSRMIRRGFNAPAAHGVGRYFDAFGALLLDRAASRYEGQIALELNMAADSGETGRYKYEIRQGETPWEIDLRPAVRDAVFESIGGESVGRIAARIHNTLAAASVDVVRAISHRVGRLAVVLSGGCFQNARLAESIVAGLEPEFRVYPHRRVPPGDGGIALGQAVVAAARARSL
jgi:hydrogenase maturation protein HypF